MIFKTSSPKNLFVSHKLELSCQWNPVPSKVKKKKKTLNKKLPQYAYLGVLKYNQQLYKYKYTLWNIFSASFPHQCTFKVITEFHSYSMHETEADLLSVYFVAYLYYFT